MNNFTCYDGLKGQGEEEAMKLGRSVYNNEVDHELGTSKENIIEKQVLLRHMLYTRGEIREEMRDEIRALNYSKGHFYES